MLVLIVCDVIGGFLAVSSGVNTWAEAWGFDTKFTVPLPVGAAQLVLAWLAARNVRPPVGLVAAVVLSAFCLISRALINASGPVLRRGTPEHPLRCPAVNGSNALNRPPTNRVPVPVRDPTKPSP